MKLRLFYGDLLEVEYNEYYYFYLDLAPQKFDLKNPETLLEGIILYNRLFSYKIPELNRKKAIYEGEIQENNQNLFTILFCGRVENNVVAWKIREELSKRMTVRVKLNLINCWLRGLWVRTDKDLYYVCRENNDFMMRRNPKKRIRNLFHHITKDSAVYIPLDNIKGSIITREYVVPVSDLIRRFGLTENEKIKVKELIS